jgi:hypothetical protein
MAEPKRISVKLSFDGGSPVRIHTDLSMFAQVAKKKVPDYDKIDKMRRISTEFKVTKGMIMRFIEE